MKILLLILLLHLPIMAFSQQAVQLRIQNAETGEAVNFATIHILGTQQVFETGNDTAFNLPLNLPARIRILHTLFHEATFIIPTGTTMFTAQLRPRAHLMDEAVVSAFHLNRPLSQTAGSIAVLDSADLHRFEPVSLVPAMNLIPGVRMEQRSPGSYRLSIRGSLLRSPFGVRDVKIYFNEIPFSEPGGNTPLNLLDVSLFNRIEIIKGPAGSVYGAGTGGVVNLFPAIAHSNRTSSTIEAASGSYGLFKTSANLNINTGQHQLQAFGTTMQSHGYREHSAMSRENVFLAGRFNLSPRQTIGVQMLYSNLFYQIPGGLTLAEFEENPRQARPATAFQPGSVEQNSSINLRFVQPGFIHTYNLTNNFSNVTSAYLSNSFFDHPFITDYKRDAQQGCGGRTRFTLNDTAAGLPFRFHLGGELQQSLVNARNFGNIGGEPDTLRFDDEIRTLQQFVFAQAEIDLPARFFLTLAGSYNFLSYDIYRVRDEIIDTSYREVRTFQPVFSPRISLVNELTNNFALHGSISFGFSPPTLPEVRTNEGSINTTLEAEQGINYEAGARIRFFGGRMQLDATAFSLELRETIVSQPSAGGVVLFRNAGATSQQGIETSILAYPIYNPGGFFRQLRYRASVTANHFRFLEYVKQGENLEGNELPGVPAHVVVQGIDVYLSPGIFTNFTWNYTSTIPLNDANTVYSGHYHLLKLQAGIRGTLLQRVNVDVYAGADNLLDEVYSLGNDLNAFGGRYYQVSPGRNYFVGLKFEM